MAKRYDQKEKDAIVAFIQEYNEKNGRGGQSAACKKYSVNPITLKAWMEKSGVPSPGKTRKKRQQVKATSRISREVNENKPSTTLAVLQKMTSIQEKLEELHSEYGKLKTAL